MNQDLTDITLLVDRSGSMESIRTDAEGGVNAFIQNQKQQTGQANLTLVQFDTHYEFVVNGVPIDQVGPYTLVPRGSTALLDAMGRAMEETGKRLAAMAEQDRPGLVVFVVMTDGQENSSKFFSKAQIREMIEHQQKVYSWTFTFLGADQDAIHEAQSLGMNARAASTFSKPKVGMAMAFCSDKVARMRAQKSAGEEVCDAFTDEEAAQMK